MRSFSGALAPPPELTELAVRLAELAAGNVDALRELRPALHRIVVAPSLSGAVKTLVVQALLLLDDPRIVDGTKPGGAPLLLKIRKLLESAMSAHATGVPTPALGVPLTRAQFSPDALLSPNTDPALVEEFVIEAREQLAMAEAALLVLDTFPDDADALDAMFRAIHSIKGTSAFLGVEHATELAHHAEALLERIRSGEWRCEGARSNLLFRAIDMLDAMLVAIETAADGDVAILPDGFRALLQTLSDAADVARSGETPYAGAARSATESRVRRQPKTVRVRAADLERLSETMGELRMANAMLSRDPLLRGGANVELARKLAHADSLADELEDIVNELRTVTFAATTQRLARVARDAAQRSGKTIEFAALGEELSIERSTAELLSDPLMHMVRNAVDHGIEAADVRERVGKPRAGRVRLAAQRMDDELVIHVSDDGRGLDARALTRTAMDRGIISRDMELSEQEAFSLILRAGFTTSAIVTDLSGRGVGMDVVRSSIERLGGTIDIDSRLGEGTTFTIRLPFRTSAADTMNTWGEPPRTIGLIA
jgi:two-component system, chemotaxis family, sensor kinase CheA